MGAPVLYEFDLDGQLEDRYRLSLEWGPTVFSMGLGIGLGIDREYDLITRAIDSAKSARFEHGESPNKTRITT